MENQEKGFINEIRDAKFPIIPIALMGTSALFWLFWLFKNGENAGALNIFMTFSAYSAFIVGIVLNRKKLAFLCAIGCFILALASFIGFCTNALGGYFRFWMLQSFFVMPCQALVGLGFLIPNPQLTKWFKFIGGAGVIALTLLFSFINLISNLRYMGFSGFISSVWGTFSGLAFRTIPMYAALLFFDPFKRGK